ncbi:hypothetical protein F2Q70_00014546 [Brassica cretica]|uniref:Uncharacterized protein n=1 Tax=Brassica cretica TaxID=69181 RepID=A0A8S9HTH6_BRACR|nr:hypothetical protein F2Q70_00014546 [Brassica cretica]
MGGRKLKVKMAIDRDEYYGYQYFDGCECCLGRGGYTPRRFAFINLINAHKNALKLSESYMGGRKLKVKMAIDRDEYYGYEYFDGCECCLGEAGTLLAGAEVEAEKVVTITDAECLIAIARMEDLRYYLCETKSSTSII